MHSQERKECLWGFLIGICRQPIVWGNIFLTRILHLMHLFCKKPRKTRKFLFGNLTQNIQIIWQTRYCSATISPNLWIEEALLKINFSQCLLLFSNSRLTMLFLYFLLFCFSLEVVFFLFKCVSWHERGSHLTYALTDEDYFDEKLFVSQKNKNWWNYVFPQTTNFEEGRERIYVWFPSSDVQRFQIKVTFSWEKQMEHKVNNLNYLNSN
jgi:hypothetical protein